MAKYFGMWHDKIFWDGVAKLFAGGVAKMLGGGVTKKTGLPHVREKQEFLHVREKSGNFEKRQGILAI